MTSTTAPRAGASPAAAPPRTAPPKRTDIQALRAIAVGSVVAWHLGIRHLSGGFAGVDIFFVISGFLITSHLLAHPPDRIRNLFDFWSRRLRRLLPAALLVLLAVLAVSRLVGPNTQWEDTADQAKASALYFVNWRLASDAGGYLTSDSSKTAVNHFWSLSVEEQFYLFWPIAILILVLLARLFRRSIVPFLLVGLGAIVAASLWYSVTYTTSNPDRAYYVTPTRVWELGAGGLLAVVVWALVARRAGGAHHHPRPDRLARPAALVLVWAGLAAIAYSVFVFDSAKTPWPGWHAAVPVLGCAAVIAAGNPRGVLAPAPLFGLRPVQWLGDVSYSVYLWHWPLIVLVPNVSGQKLGWLDKVTIVVAALILAALTKKFVEDPFRRPGWGRPLVKPFALAAVGMAVVVGAATMQTHEVHQHDAQVAAAIKTKLASGDPCFGAPALTAGPKKCPPVNSGKLVPDSAAAAKDQAKGFQGQDGVKTCFAPSPDYKPVVCDYGDKNSSVQVALLGNSHAFQFQPALEKIVEEHKWHLTTYVAAGCAYSDTPQIAHNVKGDKEGCAAWNKWASAQVTSHHYDLVITSERIQVGIYKQSYSPTPAQYAAGYETALHRLSAAGERVIAIRDTPLPKPNIPQCLAKNPTNYSACNGARSVWLPPDPMVTAVKALDDPRITTLDLTEHFCTATVCPAVIGGVPAYFDNSHMTATFAKTLVPYLDPPITRALKS